MEKINFNLDAHSSLIIADGSIVEINGQKVLLTLVKDADAPEPKKIDLYKDSWGVLNDGSQRFKDTVVKWLNEKGNEAFDGDAVEYYYGIDKDGDTVAASPDCFNHILTLDEFCALAYPETSEAGSELVGKWVRCTNVDKGWCKDIKVNSWYKIIKEKFIWGDGFDFGGYWGKYSFFDLYNPLDYNPETLIGKYWNGAKITGIYINENDRSPYFSLESTVVNSIKCSKVTPSDVTDTPPLPSLKYEDCFERLLSLPQDAINQALNGLNILFKTNPRQAKQLAATVKLMTIMHDANGGEWIPNAYDVLYTLFYDRKKGEMGIARYLKSISSPIYFKDKETALRAYEENKEIFREYFGINE